MQNRDSRKPLRTPAVLAGTLAVALALAWGAGGAFAQSAADDEEDVPLDTKLFRQLMKDLGLRRDGDGVEFRERAPLVVPPSRDLPPPQPKGTAAANPAWPKDPDQASRRKQAAAERARLKGSVDRATEEARPLSPSELDRGRVATTRGGPAAPEAVDASRPMSPSQLGNKRTFFDMVFSSFGPQRQETAPFTGEPARESMTAPPAGYQTPSPDQPYGLGLPKDTRKSTTVVDRVEAPR